MHSIFLQSNQCGGSYHMEKKGLCQSLALLERNTLVVGQLITDRHLSIGKMMREEYSDIDHLFDIWHVAKGNITFFVQDKGLPAMYEAININIAYFITS